MAGTRSNVIEYVFEGNTLNLAAAVKKVTQLLTESAETFKKYQGGAITEAQQRELQAARDLLAQLQTLSRKRKALTQDQARQAAVAGREALRQSQRIAREAERVAERRTAEISKYTSVAAMTSAQQHAGFLETGAQANKDALGAQAYDDIMAKVERYKAVLADSTSTDEQKADAVKGIEQAYRDYASIIREVTREAERAESELDVMSTAGRELAKQNAAFLKSYAEEFKSALSPEAYNNIMLAVQEYETAMQDTTLAEEDQRRALENLNKTYEEYQAVLHRARNATLAAGHAVTGLSSFLSEAKRYVEMTTKSFSFWLRVLRKVYQIIKEGITLFADYVESINFLERASGDAAEAMTAFTKAQVTAFGLDPTKINTATAMFYSFANSMGFADAEATLMSQNLAKLAQDIASLQNIEVDVAATKLRSALAGHSRALAQLGVNVNDVNVEEWLLSKGIRKTMNDMNEASQAAARYAFILDSTTAAQGDLAKTIESPANQIKILKTQIQLLKQNLGAVATQVLMPLIRVLNYILRPINALLQGLSSITASGFSNAIGDATDDMEDLTDSTDEAADAIKGLAGLDEINQMTKQAGTDATLPGEIDSDISSLLTGYDNLAGVGFKLTEIFGQIGEALAPVFSSLGVMMEPILEFLQNVLGLVGTLLKPLATVAGWIGNIFKLLTPVAEFLSKILNWIVSVLDKIISNMALLIPLIIAVIALIAVNHWAAFIASLKGIAVGFWGIVKAIAGAIKSLALWIYNSLKAIVTNIKNAFSAWIAEKAYWKVAVAAIAAAGILGLAITAIVLTATSAVESKATSSVGDAPHMATGGIVTEPTFAMVGEGKFNEAVIPLGNSPQFAEMKTDIAKEVLAGLGGVSTSGSPQPVYLQIDGKTFARLVLPKMKEVAPQVGVKLG